MMYHMMFSRQQQYIQVIRYCVLDYISDYEHGVVTDNVVAWLSRHNHNVNPSIEGSLPNIKGTSGLTAAY